jgi:dTMP kinase
VTFLLAVDPGIAHDRIEARGYDHETIEYLSAAAAAYRSLPEYGEFVVIDANAAPDQVAAEIRSRLPVPAPVTPARARARTVIRAGGPLLAGATALGYQLAEAL